MTSPKQTTPESTETPEVETGPEQAATAENGDANEAPEPEQVTGQEDADPELDDLVTALAEAHQESAACRDAMLRMQAEMENLRKRLIRDLERSRRLALEQFMNALLPVYDSLERGLGMAGDTATVESLREGKALTLKLLTKTMQDHGLDIIDPVGEPFDPEFHEAMTMLPSADHDENTVMEVIQKGFRLHERLVRPARVIVSRKPD